MSVPAYVQKVLTAFGRYLEMADGWEAKCPCPGHGKGRGDERPSVRVTVGDEGKILVKCRSGCPKDQVLAGAGLTWRDLWPSDLERPLAPMARKTEALAEEEADLRHRVYTAFLESLELREEHREHLLGRGFTDDEIDYRGYKTIGLNSLVLFEHPEKGQVPGLDFPDDDPPSAIYRGIAVPVRDWKGRVVGIKVRRLAGEGPKYLALSGMSPGSKQAGSPGHFALTRGGIEPGTNLLITEGEFKADLWSQHHNECAVGVPGVTNWRPLLRDFPRVPGMFGDDGEPNVSATIAFDCPDVVAQEGVRHQVRQLKDALVQAGFLVNMIVWDPDGPKGIDDVLVSGTPFRTLGGSAVDEYLDALDPAPAVAVPEVRTERFAFGECPEFPLDVFPPEVADYLGKVAESLNDAPVDFPGVAALAQASAAIGATRRVRCKSSWPETAALYLCLVAKPGSAKTPAIKHVTRPMHELQEKSIYDHRRRGESLPESERKKLGPAPEFYSANATTEAVVDRLGHNPRGLCILSDEILSWTKGMDQYRAGNDRQFYLSAWSNVPFKLDRKTGEKPMVYLPCPYLTVVGGVQPAKLPSLGVGSPEDDGFIDRMLFAYPPERPFPDWKEADVADEDYEPWGRAVRRLYGIPLPEKGPLDVPLAGEAKEAYVAWYNARARELRDPDFPAFLEGSQRKMFAYALRLALVLTLVTWALDPELGAAEPEVTVGAVEGAAKLCAYFRGHAHRVLREACGEKEQEELLALLKWVWSGAKTGSASARQVACSKNPALPRKMGKIRELFTLAQTYGLGECHPERDGEKDVFVSHAKTRELAAEGRLC